MSTITVQLTPQELQKMIEAALENVLDDKFNEWFGEKIDDGELRPEVRQQLLKQLKAVKNGERGSPLNVVMKELGLH